MIGCDARLKRRIDEDFAAGVISVCAGNFEDGAGAVTDEEVAVAIESDTCRDAHALGVGGDGTLRGDAVDGAFGARADVEVTVGTKREPGGVENLPDERANLKIALNLEDGDGDGLTTCSGDGSVDVSIGVDGWIGNGVEVFGHG